MRNQLSIPASNGPAMSALTPNQQEFVRLYIDQGGRNKLQCYMGAYPNCTSKNSAQVESGRMLAKESILLAIKEEADKKIRAGAILGAAVLMEIADNPQHKDQLKAATELLNRAGLIVATQHKLTIVDQRADNEIIEDIKRLAAKNNIDARSLLGDSLVTDVEFTEICSDGLEDLLE